eukprot:8480986-Pyramimonas_sp.AAC.1
MRGLLPPTPSGTPPGGVARLVRSPGGAPSRRSLAALGLSDRLARPGNVKEGPHHHRSCKDKYLRHRFRLEQTAEI